MSGEQKPSRLMVTLEVGGKPKHCYIGVAGGGGMASRSPAEKGWGVERMKSRSLGEWGRGLVWKETHCAPPLPAAPLAALPRARPLALPSAHPNPTIRACPSDACLQTRRAVMAHEQMVHFPPRVTLAISQTPTLRLPHPRHCPRS